MLERLKPFLSNMKERLQFVSPIEYDISLTSVHFDNLLAAGGEEVY